MNIFVASIFCTVLVLMCGNICEGDSLILGYITPCSLSDPKFNDCAYKTARAAMKKFAAGNKEKGVPPLEPLFVKELRALGSKNGGISVILTDAKLLGLRNLDLKKFKIDMNKRKIIGKAVGDLVIDSMYNISGRILIIPLIGNGHCRVDLLDLKLSYMFDFDIVKDKNGKEHIKILQNTQTLKYEIGKAVFHFENLFNGDRILGDSTHRILNESWKDVVAEVGPPIANILKEAFGNTIQKFLNSESLDELFLP